MDEATHTKNFKPINLCDLFMDKNPKVGGWIPPFVFRSLSRMLRKDFFNYPILYKHGYKKDVVGKENLKEDERFIFAKDPEREFTFIKNESPSS